MNPAWKFDLPMEPENFIQTFEISNDITWYNECFNMTSEDIVARGGPKELQQAVKSFGEVESLHPLILLDPNYFLAISDACWYYTGKVGAAPDFVGFDKSGNAHIVEVKWNEGFPEKLIDQVYSYATASWRGICNEIKITIHIASTQGYKRSVVSKFCSQMYSLSQWKSVKIRFGGLLIGWRKEITNNYFLKVIWNDGESWDGNKFGDSGENDICYYGEAG